MTREYVIMNAGQVVDRLVLNNKQVEDLRKVGWVVRPVGCGR